MLHYAYWWPTLTASLCLLALRTEFPGVKIHFWMPYLWCSLQLLTPPTELLSQTTLMGVAA